MPGINPPEISHYGIRTSVRSIIGVVGILLVTMWAGVGCSLVASRQHALDDAGSQSRNLMIAFREEVAQILRGVEGETDLIAQKLRSERGNFDLYGWGREQVLVSPGMAEAGIADPDGKLRRSTITPRLAPIDISDRAHFRVHLDGKFHGLYIGQSIIGRITGLPTLPISRRVEAEDGTFLGVVVMLLSPGALTTLHKSIDLGPHGVITLSGLDNVIRARFSADSGDGTVGLGRPIVGGPQPADSSENGEGRYVHTSRIDGITRVYAYGRVGNYPLVVRVGLTIDSKLAAWRSYTAMLVAMALGATMLLIGLAAYLIRQVYRDAAQTGATTLAITHTAEHDFLTGLPNRMLLNDRIGQAIAVAQRHQNKLAVLFLDLDGFKRINDTLGHSTGDGLLQSVAERLVACVRGSDTISRQGGDEFVALLSEVRRPEDAAIAARKILEVTAEPYYVDQHELRVTASIGVSLYPEDGLDVETLLKNADAAMYQAKASGRQCYRFFTPAVNLQAAERKPNEEGLRLAG